METINLLDNIIDQIKEAQLKLGYVKEVIRLYYPVSSLCRLLKMEYCNGETLLERLESRMEFRNSILGNISFFLCDADRIEIRIPAAGASYVHEHIPDPPFLVSIIELFGHKHDFSEQEITMKDICTCFERFNDNYVCEKMGAETDFDYVLYFLDQNPDAWYYCIKYEMNHVIYHRFTKEDYYALVIS